MGGTYTLIHWKHFHTDDGKTGIRWKDRHSMERPGLDGKIGIRWKDWHWMGRLGLDGTIGIQWKDWRSMERLANQPMERQAFNGWKVCLPEL